MQTDILLSSGDDISFKALVFKLNGRDFITDKYPDQPGGPHALSLNSARLFGGVEVCGQLLVPEQLWANKIIGYNQKVTVDCKEFYFGENEAFAIKYEGGSYNLVINPQCHFVRVDFNSAVSFDELKLIEGKLDMSSQLGDVEIKMGQYGTTQAVLAKKGSKIYINEEGTSPHSEITDVIIHGKTSMDSLNVGSFSASKSKDVGVTIDYTKISFKCIANDKDIGVTIDHTGISLKTALIQIGDVNESGVTITSKKLRPVPTTRPDTGGNTSPSDLPHATRIYIGSDTIWIKNLAAEHIPPRDLVAEINALNHIVKDLEARLKALESK